MGSIPKDLEINTGEKAPAAYEDPFHSGAPSSPSDHRNAVLSSFSAEEDKAVMRKVDRRFLLLIGLMYMLKNIDYTNAATVKVLQVGQSRNILKQLHMTADEYNWVQSIYFVSSVPICNAVISDMSSQISYIVFEVPSNLLLKKATPRNWQFRIILTWGVVSCPPSALETSSDPSPLGPCLPRCSEEQARYLCRTLLPRNDGGRTLPWFGSAIMFVVSQ